MITQQLQLFFNCAGDTRQTNHLQFFFTSIPQKEKPEGTRATLPSESKGRGGEFSGHPSTFSFPRYPAHAACLTSHSLPPSPPQLQLYKPLFNVYTYAVLTETAARPRLPHTRLTFVYVLRTI